MFGIGRKIKKDFFGYLLRYLKNNFSEKIYSFFVFLSIFKKFKREINKKKKFDQFSKNLDQINNFEFRITSQNNEDGIIQHIFNKIPTNKYFVELGFGTFQSNSLNLIQNGWNGLLIDADKNKCLEMRRCINYFFPKNEIKILNKKIDVENVNDLIYSNITSKVIDFLSIDVDGNDYWILNKINTDSINLICCEYNPWIGRDVKKTIPYDKNFIYKGDFYFGASLNALTSLLKPKKFDLIAVESSGTNGFFLKNDFSSSFQILSPIDSFRKASRYTKDEVSEIEKIIKNYKFIEVNDL